jgi:hypothetical protein
MAMRRIVWVVAIALVVLLLATVSVAIARPAFERTIWQFVQDYRWWLALAVTIVAGVFLLRWLLGAFLGHQRCSPWRAHVRASADTLKHQLKVLPPGRTRAQREFRDAVGQAVGDHLRAACKFAAWDEEDGKDNQGPSVGRQFNEWWTGASCEGAYVNLHEAEIALAQLLPDDEIQASIPAALARLQTMDVTDPRRRAAETQLAGNVPRAQRRAAFQSAVRTGLELIDQQHARLRGFRNIVLTTTAGLMLLVVAMCVVGAWKPDALPLCFGPEPTTATGQPSAPIQGPVGVACPSEEAPPSPGTQPRRLPAPGDVTLVALLGLMGGGLSGALAIRHLQGSSTPYDVPVALSLLKLPSGALLALVGILFVRGGFVPGLSQLDSQPQILAYAFLFGSAQQLVTRLIDRQAQDILTKVPSKEPTTTKPEPPPVEQPTPGRRLTRRLRQIRTGAAPR